MRSASSLTLKSSVSMRNAYPPFAPCGHTRAPSHSGQCTRRSFANVCAVAFSSLSRFRIASLRDRSQEKYRVSGPAKSTRMDNSLAVIVSSFVIGILHHGHGLSLSAERAVRPSRPSCSLGSKTPPSEHMNQAQAGPPQGRLSSLLSWSRTPPSTSTRSARMNGYAVWLLWIGGFALLGVASLTRLLTWRDSLSALSLGS